MPEHRTSTQQTQSLTYLDAGVDTKAGNAMIAPFKAIAERTRRPEMLSNIGGFAALCQLPANYQEPVLVTGADGVGTKLKLAIALGQHEGLGQDLVAMSVNDILVTGAEPLLFLDYFATSGLNQEVIVEVVRGIGAGCELAGCSLAGGETAEMPGLYQQGDYDLAGFCVGVVEKADIIDGTQIQAGDVLIGIPSSGPHSNGFSLIRMILEKTNTELTQMPELAAQLMAPTRIYVPPVRHLLNSVKVLGMAHITGGGIEENLPRILPSDADLSITIDLNSWRMPEVFVWLQQQGNISDQEMLRTFNCGVGMVVCVRKADQQAALRALEKVGEAPFVVGQIEAVPDKATPGNKTKIRFRGTERASQ